MNSIDFQCRSCGSNDGTLVLNLGIQPLANNLLSKDDIDKPEPKFPLRLAVCRSCWLMQILDLVPPVQLFSEYLYFSSFSDAMLRHAREASTSHIRRFALGQQNFVIEIASNDGYLLQNFVAAKIPCLGIEPAQNIAKCSLQKGIDTICDFFSENMAEKLVKEGKSADLILGNNVFAHVPDTNDFVAGLKKLLRPTGTIVLEFPYGVDMIEHSEFDTICHEHVFYFTLSALRPLLTRHDLEIYNIERLQIHGGSLRLFISHVGVKVIDESVTNLILEEQGKGVATLEYYERFASDAERIRKSLTDLVRQLKSQGKTVAAYGASAKGSTLLNYVGFDRDDLQFVADRSTYKQGRLTPGTHIPIIPADDLVRRQPDYTLLLTWNFQTEILTQQSAYRMHGGKFIVPIPSVTVI